MVDTLVRERGRRGPLLRRGSRPNVRSMVAFRGCCTPPFDRFGPPSNTGGYAEPMGPEEAVAFLETPFDYPGSEKSGEYLLECVRTKAQWLVDNGERSALVGALQGWLTDRSEPRTMMAVDLAGYLALQELRPDLASLRGEIDAGKVFMRFYLKRIDAAATAIGAATDRHQ